LRCGVDARQGGGAAGFFFEALGFEALGFEALGFEALVFGLALSRGLLALLAVLALALLAFLPLALFTLLALTLLTFLALTFFTFLPLALLLQSLLLLTFLLAAFLLLALLLGFFALPPFVVQTTLFGGFPLLPLGRKSLALRFLTLLAFLLQALTLGIFLFATLTLSLFLLAALLLAPFLGLERFLACALFLLLARVDHRPARRLRARDNRNGDLFPTLAAPRVARGGEEQSVRPRQQCFAIPEARHANADRRAAGNRIDDIRSDEQLQHVRVFMPLAGLRPPRPARPIRFE
jgi:hypothetical protein